MLTTFIAGRIRLLRKAHGLSAAALAERCHALGVEMNRDTIANIETGRRARISVDELAVIGLALNFSPTILFSDALHQSGLMEAK